MAARNGQRRCCGMLPPAGPRVSQVGAFTRSPDHPIWWSQQYGVDSRGAGGLSVAHVDRVVVAPRPTVVDGWASVLDRAVQDEVAVSPVRRLIVLHPRPQSIPPRLLPPGHDLRAVGVVARLV